MKKYWACGIVILLAAAILVWWYQLSFNHSRNMGKSTMTAPVLKVGIIGDVHAYASPHDWGMFNLEKALKLFRAKNIDLLVLAGDLAEGPDQDTYQYYWQLLHQCFSDKLPATVSCDGNHDAIKRGGKDAQTTFELFCQGLNRSKQNPERQNIGGYDFITFSHYRKVSDGDLAALDAILQKRTAQNPGKPIFVISHEAPAQTLPDSFMPKHTEFKQVLKKYPEVVAISGHTHWPIEDERSLYLGDFTAFQCGTLSYGCMTDSQAYNLCNGIVPFAREVTQALYLEIYADRLEIQRWNVTSKKEVAPRWQIPLPYRPGRDLRKQQVKLPLFSSDAQILFRYDYGYLYLIFDAARRGGMTIYYDVEIAPRDPVAGDWGAGKTYRYVGDFYRWPENRSRQLFFKLPNVLKSDMDYRFRIYPVGAFGRRGQPIAAIYHSRFNLSKDSNAVYPQE